MIQWISVGETKENVSQGAQIYTTHSQKFFFELLNYE